ncbi:MAG: hypothetical protein CMJ78_07915 [Planctomycetaceae bacterium]|nr:hypothetical protein [Planctomycetaceae bacterium]
MYIKCLRQLVDWIWNSSRVQIGIGAALLILLIAWLLPRRVDQIVTVDQLEEWAADDAPIVREVVWQTPTQLAEFRDDGAAQFVTPHLTDNGASLYFSRRVEAGGTDIFVTRLVDGVWQDPQLLPALNSNADDLGPVISANGRELYFYSNRAGGLGGTDLYVSQRTPQGWSTPKNVGPEVNSSADEFDPALSPDGRTVYFASNRNDAPRPRQRAEGESPPWKTTLRAQRDRVTFDLLHARRESVDSPWNAASMLTTVNQPNASEGAAFVSPDGAFLYFASDRIWREGESRNLDLYRAPLIDGLPGEPVNLGAGINTAADETEPALSPEGFTLVFSSNREGSDRLYSSQAREILRRKAWDTSHLPSRRGIWLLLLSLLLLAVAACLVWKRDTVAARLWPARFFLGSVVINLLLLTLLTLWKFPEVLTVVSDVFEDSVPAPEMLDENAHQSHEDGREAYEKVADLKSLDAETIPEVVRQVTDPTSVPERTERIEANISVQEARALPPDQVMFIAPEPVVTEATKPTNDSPLKRRRPTRAAEIAMLPDEPDMELPTEALPEESPPEVEPTPDIAATEPSLSTAIPDRAQPVETPTTRPDAAPPISAVNRVEETAPAQPNSNPFQQRPRKRNATVAAAESNLPDLPDAETIAALESVQSQNADLDRTVDTKTPSPAAAAAKTVDSPLPNRRPSKRTQSVIAADTELPIATNRPSRLPGRSRSQQSVTAVASLDAEAEEPAATEIPTETSIAGTRPKLDRSSATTVGIAKQPASSPTTLPNAQPSRAQNVESAPMQDQVALASPFKPNSRLKRRRPTRRQDVELVTDPTTETSPPTTDEPKLTTAPIQSVDANLKRDQTAKVTIKTSELRTRTDNIANAVAGRLKAEQPKLAAERIASLSPETLRNASRSPLKRRRTGKSSPMEISTSVDAEIADSVGEETAVAESELATDDSTVARQSGVPLTASVTTRRDMSGPSSSIQNRIVVGELSEKKNNAPPAFSPIASRLNRKRARAMKVALAEDNVGLQALFTLRQGDTRRKHIELLGGSEETERAVNRGLEWLAKNQLDDGSWDLQKHQGNTKSATAGTGLGLLPFLAAGYTHNIDGQYRDHVGKAIKRLLESQQESGELNVKGHSQRMYSHGIAAIALCEAFAMSQDQELRQPAQKALNFIVAAQHKSSGGWRYNPNEKADTSVVGWQMMALKSGEMAGLSVPSASYDLVKKWLNSVESKSGPGGTFGYTNRSATPAMTAEGLLCLQFMGTPRNDPKMRYGADFILKSLPQKTQRLTSYYWYYATQAMYHMQGDYWNQWNERTKEILISTQEKNGNNAGTWSPKDNWEKAGGRVYATSIKLLMLEVYYRHLPLYDQLEF